VRELRKCGSEGTRHCDVLHVVCRVLCQPVVQSPPKAVSAYEQGEFSHGGVPGLAFGVGAAAPTLEDLERGTRHRA
jgi:hypothetical protein